MLFTDDGGDTASPVLSLDAATDSVFLPRIAADRRRQLGLLDNGKTTMAPFVKRFFGSGQTPGTSDEDSHDGKSGRRVLFFSASKYLQYGILTGRRSARTRPGTSAPPAASAAGTSAPAIPSAASAPARGQSPTKKRRIGSVAFKDRRKYSSSDVECNATRGLVILGVQTGETVLGRIRQLSRRQYVRRLMRT